MKTYITLRSTLSSASRMQRSVAALLIVAPMLAFTLAWRANTSWQAPVSAAKPAPVQAAPAARHAYVPALGTGSVYDGGAYGQQPAARSPYVPALGTGSVYDGQ
jgi:hypothetical protein